MTNALQDPPRILLVDDEETFRSATADLLKEAGYVCDTAEDGPAAEQCLRAGQFDLLVADILMPGNSNLDFLRTASELGNGISMVLVTGYPSLQTALDALHLGVTAYLVKPFDWDDFIRRVAAGIEATRARRLFRQAHERLGSHMEQLRQVGQVETTPGVRPALTSYLQVTLSSIAYSLHDLLQIASAAQGESLGQLSLAEPACHLFHCPRRVGLETAVRDAIRVLEQTKKSFHSRELADLRHSLEEVLKAG